MRKKHGEERGKLEKEWGLRKVKLEAEFEEAMARKRERQASDRVGGGALRSGT